MSRHRQEMKIFFIQINLSFYLFMMVMFERPYYDFAMAFLIKIYINLNLFFLFHYFLKQ